MTNLKINTTSKFILKVFLAWTAWKINLFHTVWSISFCMHYFARNISRSMKQNILQISLIFFSWKPLPVTTGAPTEHSIKIKVNRSGSILIFILEQMIWTRDAMKEIKRMFLLYYGFSNLEKSIRCSIGPDSTQFYTYIGGGGS